MAPSHGPAGGGTQGPVCHYGQPPPAGSTDDCMAHFPNHQAVLQAAAVPIAGSDQVCAGALLLHRAGRGHGHAHDAAVLLRTDRPPLGRVPGPGAEGRAPPRPPAHARGAWGPPCHPGLPLLWRPPRLPLPPGAVPLPRPGCAPTLLPPCWPRVLPVLPEAVPAPAGSLQSPQEAPQQPAICHGTAFVRAIILVRACRGHISAHLRSVRAQSAGLQGGLLP